MILWESYDKNEAYIFLLLLIAYTTLLILPKKLPYPLTILFLIWGFASATLFDFTIGGGMLDYYKVNDSNQYELTDLLSYFLFATFSYFFVYFYHVFQINKKLFIPYILGWTIIVLLMEKLSTIMGVTHYQNGYKLHFSLVVFLVVQTTTALFFELIKSKYKKTEPAP